MSLRIILAQLESYTTLLHSHSHFKQFTLFFSQTVLSVHTNSSLRPSVLKPFSSLLSSPKRLTFRPRAQSLCHTFPICPPSSANFFAIFRTFVRIFIYYNTNNLTNLCQYFFQFLPTAKKETVFLKNRFSSNSAKKS